tara:strand:+ start:588 stop:875 length:288 start_codon:yes stop_codon:yes gene_type:complete
LFNLKFKKMSEKKETIYCGNGKEKKFDDGGSIVNFTVHLDKIRDHVYEYEGKKYVNLTMSALKGGANEYGKTHSVRINDFEPDSSKKKGGEDLPF